MKAHFYILSESFHNNANLTDFEIEEKIKRLAEDVNLINRHKESNVLYVNFEDIYSQVFYSTYTVFDFICKPSELKQKGIDRDIINALQSIIQKAESTTYTYEEVKNVLLLWTDENNCHGIVAFNPIDSLDEQIQIIYGVDGWYKFRRHFLGIYPQNASFFLNECIKYFPKLYFHIDNYVSIKSILNDCAKKIIYHLSALNDEFKNIQKIGLNRTEVLEQFSRIAKLDESASLEGDANRKKKLTFTFINSKGENEDVCCEPHLKLCYSDTDTSYSTDRRIYFHEGKSHIQNDSILIGHIGKHL